MNATRGVSAGPPGRPPRRRLVLCAFHSLLALSVFGDALPGTNPAPGPADPVAVQPVAAPAPPADADSPLDEPLRLVAEARRSYRQVRDYTCLMVKREKLQGQLSPDHLVRLAVRTQPFSVDMLWQGPAELNGQEACYVAGKNKGRMRARSAGVLGKLGFVTLDPDDPRTRESSNHSITEAGIGHLIERYAKLWEQERALNRTAVKLSTYDYNKRRCTRVEATHADNRDGRFPAYRTVLYFDQETHLPIRLELYDWPRDGGERGELIELYAYVNLRLNVGLGDEAFDH